MTPHESMTLSLRQVDTIFIAQFFHQGLLPEFHYQGNGITKFQHQRKENATEGSAEPKQYQT
jgi:hypothetical protein